jgi:hypothetical protein
MPRWSGKRGRVGGESGGAGARAGLERLAAENVKRVFAADDDWAAAPGTRRLLAFCETKTV